jgi:hypothetical protein
MPRYAHACVDAIALRQVTEAAARTAQFRSYTADSARAGLCFCAKGMNGNHTGCQGRGHESCRQEFLHLVLLSRIAIYCLRKKFRPSHFSMRTKFFPPARGFNRGAMSQNGTPPGEKFRAGIRTRHSIFPLCALWSRGSPITGNFARFRKVPGPAPLRRGTELFWPIIYLP